MYQLGDLVLIEYPYTDLIGVKLRPAVVLKDTNDNDFIVVRATTQSKQTEFDIEIADWEKAGLLKPSIIRIHKLTSLETKLVKRRMGILSAADVNNLTLCLKKLFDFN